MQKVYKVSIIGAGNIASFYDNPKENNILTHAHSLVESEHYVLAGFYDNDIGKADKAVQVWGGRVFSTLEEAINSADVVVIAVPDGFHYEMVKKCLSKESLKAIIVEKPFVTNEAEANLLVRELRNKHIPVLLNYSRRFRKEFIELKNWIDLNSGKFLSGSCYYGKGTLHNGSHLIDIISYFFEDVKLDYVGRSITDYIENDPSYEFTLSVRNDEGVVHFLPISCTAVTVFEFDLIFEHGRIKYSDENGVIEYYEVKRQNPLYDEFNFVKSREVQIDPSGAMLGLYSNLYEVLSNKGTPYCTAEDGAFVSSMICGIANKGGKE